MLRGRGRGIVVTDEPWQIGCVATVGGAAVCGKTRLNRNSKGEENIPALYTAAAAAWERDLCRSPRPIRFSSSFSTHFCAWKNREGPFPSD